MQENLGHDSLEQIQEHVEKNIGKVERVFHELVSDIVHVDILIVEPTEEKNYYSLITSGMSDKPMNVPDQDPSSRYVELMINLPATWKLGQEDFQDETWYWPVRLLKSLARFPHLYKTFLAYGHTIQNGNFDNYDQDNKFCGSILLPLFGDTQEGRYLQISDNKVITFYTVLPLYKKEIDYALKHSSNAFFDKLIQNDFSTQVNVKRKSYV